MTRCVPPSDVPFDMHVAGYPAASAAMDGITAQDYLENPELKVYVQDALRLVLAARPERPLDLINDYLQSVLRQANVVGREYAYVNATMRNRRAFVLAVHEVFVGRGGAGDGDDGGDASAVGSGNSSRGGRGEGMMMPTVNASGFAQRDVVHLLGLVCPDFPEELVSRVARTLAQGLRHVSPHHLPGYHTPTKEPALAPTAPPPSELAPASVVPSSTAASVTATEAGSVCGSSGPVSRDEKSGKSPTTCAAGRHETEVDSLPFEVFLRACSLYFCFQEFFEDICTLFSSLASNVDEDGCVVGAGNAKARAHEANLRILLDQLQVMKAEPRNQLRYMDVRSTEAAVHRGGLGERVTLPAFLACLLLHSDGVALSLLERPPVDGYADRLESCPALWSDGRISPQSSGEGGETGGESQGRRKKGTRKGGNGRSGP